MKLTSSLIWTACMAIGLTAAPSMASGVLDGRPKTLRDVNAPFLYAVTWQQSSAENAAIGYQTYRAAERVIAEKIRLGGYKMREGRLYQDTIVTAPDGTMFTDSRPVAIVLDLDETVFDNSPYEAFSTLRPGAYDNGYWTHWCTYQAETPAAQKTVPGSVEFLKKCMEWGVTPIYLTNRDMPDREATIKTLRGMGLDSATLEEQTITRDKANDKIRAQEFIRKMGWAADDPRALEITNNASDKAGRRALVESEYKVIGYFGDNLYDHPVVVDPAARQHEAIEARRHQVDINADRFGIDLFVLPNVTYGSWVKTSIYPERSKSAIKDLDDCGFGEWVKKNGLDTKKSH